MTPATACPLSFDEFADHYRQAVDRQLARCFKAKQPLSRLMEAMQYSLLSPGKRVRPLLVYAGALAINQSTALTDKAAAAIECIHAYSLIHDDLPAMDNDHLRRGRATCHIAFDEATATLAGDALQTLAFELLSEPTTTTAAVTQLAMTHLLAKASGSAGMANGQALDLQAVNNRLHLDDLMAMHHLKTGALIQASVCLGALSTEAATEQQHSCLKKFSAAIGLAFQIQDDVLDVTADTQTLGKQQGADAAQSKPTFVSLLGLSAAREQADSYYNHALQHLEPLGDKAEHLRQLAAYIVHRTY
ncbi:MAG: polyprenyl synthetase family protein [Cellvibrionaceae bacterium]|nr:polyprenyl synthetase family protein [Cellvibrionaceae bacterium]